MPPKMSCRVSAQKGDKGGVWGSFLEVPESFFFFFAFHTNFRRVRTLVDHGRVRIEAFCRFWANHLCLAWFYRLSSLHNDPLELR